MRSVREDIHDSLKDIICRFEDYCKRHNPAIFFDIIRDEPNCQAFLVKYEVEQYLINLMKRHIDPEKIIFETDHRPDGVAFIFRVKVVEAPESERAINDSDGHWVIKTKDEMISPLQDKDAKRVRRGETMYQGKYKKLAPIEEMVGPIREPDSTMTQSAGRTGDLSCPEAKYNPKTKGKVKPYPKRTDPIDMALNPNPVEKGDTTISGKREEDLHSDIATDPLRFTPLVIPPYTTQLEDINLCIERTQYRWRQGHADENPSRTIATRAIVPAAQHYPEPDVLVPPDDSTPVLPKDNPPEPDTQIVQADDMAQTMVIPDDSASRQAADPFLPSRGGFPICGGQGIMGIRQIGNRKATGPVSNVTSFVGGGGGSFQAPKTVQPPPSDTVPSKPLRGRQKSSIFKSKINKIDKFW
jgi:hypothetical protein